MLTVVQALVLISSLLLFGWRTQAMEAALSISPFLVNDISLSDAMTAATLSKSKLLYLKEKFKEQCEGLKHCGIAEPAIESGAAAPPKEYYWSLVDDLEDGRSALQSLQHKLESGEIFGVETDWRHRIVGFRLLKINKNDGADEDHTVLCEVEVIKGIGGPPEDCGTVAIITPNATLLRSKIWDGSYHAIGFRVDLITIDIDFTIKTVREVSSFSDTFGKLIGEDLQLRNAETEFWEHNNQVVSIDFKCASPLRDSLILPSGWRESLNFDLNVRRKDANTISIHASTRPLVNYTAAPNLASYTPPNEAQRGQYATSLDTYVKNAILRACPNGKALDNKTINCD
jgi:hypothetical protein